MSEGFYTYLRSKFLNLGYVLDTVIFEGSYIVLFICLKDGDISKPYLFVTYRKDADEVGWIGAKTTYIDLKGMLKNEITIRDMFLRDSKKQLLLISSKETGVQLQNIGYIPVVSSEDTSMQMIFLKKLEFALPDEGEYLEAEYGEFDGILAIFDNRIKELEELTCDK